MRLDGHKPVNSTPASESTMTTEPRTHLSDPREIADALAKWENATITVSAQLREVLTDAIIALRNVKDPTYNGWANYETWCVNLWLDNDEGSHDYWRETAEEIYADSEQGEYPWQTPRQQAIYALAQQLKDTHEENEPDIDGVYSGMLSASFSEVRWDDIAEHFIDAAIEAYVPDDDDDDDSEDDEDA